MTQEQSSGMPRRAPARWGAILATCTGYWALGLALLLLAAHVWLFRSFAVDDAYITFRYIRQWTHGHGLVYNVGERVEGYSNFLWIALLAPFDRLGVDLLLAAKVLGVFLGGLTLFLTHRLSPLGPARGVACLLLAASGPFAAWAVGGLETPLFTFLLVAATYALLLDEAGGRGLRSGALFALLSLTRPEGLVFALVALGWRAWRLWCRRLRPWRGHLEGLAAFGAVALPYAAWRLAYYGYPFPNTVYAKSMGLHPRALLEGLLYLYHSIAGAGGWLLVGLPLLLAATVRPRQPQVSFAAAALAAWAFFVVAGGGDWMPMLRFAVPVLPLFYLLVEEGLEKLVLLWPLFSGRWVSGLLTLLVGGQVACLVAASLEQRFVAGVGSGPVRPVASSRQAYLWRRVRPGDTVALVDAGRIADQLPLEARVVDMVGLTDVHIAHQQVHLPGGLFGRGDAFGKWDVDYVLAQAPRYVQVNLTGRAEDGRWLTNFTGTTLLVNDPRFRDAYERVTEPGVDGIFARREGR